MLPKGWKAVALDSLVERLDSGVSVNGEDRPIAKDELGVLKISAVTYGVFDPTAHKVVNADEIARVKVCPRADRIIVSRSNTADLVGASAYIRDDHPSLFLSDKLWQIEPKGKSTIHMPWLAQWLSYEKTRLLLSKLATGTSGSMKNISKGAFLALQVNLPPAPEQKRIADALATWNEAIATTERLLTNNHKQKKALINFILTGQRRLPGYAGIWKKLTLNEVCTFHKGGGLAKDNISKKGSRPCILYGELFTTYEEVIETVKSRTDSEFGFVASYGDVLIPTATTTVAEDLAKASALLVDDVAIGGDAIVIRPDMNKLAPEFLAYLLTYVKKREIAARAQGATIVHLSVGDIEDLEILVPSVPEQRAIATVFRTLALEAKAFKRDIHALKQAKKALMQQLLTGKRRVQVAKKTEAALT